MSSHWEGCQVALVEAMAAGVLFVSTPVGAVPEFLSEGVNGFGAPIGNPAALAEKIMKAASIQPDLRSRITDNAYEIVKKMFSSETIIAQYERFYRDTVIR